MGCVVTSLVVDWLSRACTVAKRCILGLAYSYYGTLIGNPTPGIQWYNFRPPGVTPNRGRGPPWGAFCQITLTSCFVIVCAWHADLKGYLTWFDLTEWRSMSTQCAPFDMTHLSISSLLMTAINFQIHFVSLASLVLIHLLIHSSSHCHHHHSPSITPALFHCSLQTYIFNKSFQP